MARPTKEEAKGWQDLLRRCWEAHEGLERDEYDALMAWLQRVAAALPSAAAVQRDRERLARCSLCGQRDGEHGPDCERHPDRPAD